MKYRLLRKIDGRKAGAEVAEKDLGSKDRVKALLKCCAIQEVAAPEPASAKKDAKTKPDPEPKKDDQ